MPVFAFTVLEQKYSFHADLLRKEKVFTLSQDLTQTKLNMEKLIVVFTFSVLVIPFWVNLIQRIKIISLI